MTDGRLPAHVEVSGLLRTVQAAGGFGTVIQKGERDAGVLLVLTTNRGENTTLWERMPQLDGSRRFEVSRSQDPDKKEQLDEYLAGRRRQDPDCWIVELDVENAERFIAPGHP